MARVLGVYSYELFSLWIAEFYGETWREIEPLIQPVKPKC